MDTNVLIYDTFEDTVYHKEARSLLDSLLEWNVPSVVIIEFVAFLNKLHLKREDILNKLDELINDPKFNLIEVEKEDLLAALKIVEGEQLSPLRLNDKIILSVSSRRKENLQTFDKKLKREFENLSKKQNI
ncbi:MAG: PIN domain-containing protein [Thermoproteota archaeon]